MRRKSFPCGRKATTKWRRSHSIKTRHLATTKVTIYSGRKRQGMLQLVGEGGVRNGILQCQNIY